MCVLLIQKKITNSTYLKANSNSVEIIIYYLVNFFIFSLSYKYNITKGTLKFIGIFKKN